MRRIVLLAVVALLAVAAIAPAAVAADEGNFDLTVKHRINGNPIANQLGLNVARELPVDVYVNGGLAIEDFMLSDTVKTQLPAGDYFIQVKLADTDTVVLDLQTGDIPAGANVEIMAKRTGNLTAELDGIGLKVKVK